MTVDAGPDGVADRTDAAAPVLHPTDPRQVAGLRLLGRLGEGGMGVVFLGQADNGHLVAVKVIRADYARDQHFRARFAAEAAAARRVARFCTAPVLDVGADGDLAYLVTEYIEGPTLTTAVERQGPMRGSTLDGLAIGVCAALHGIHAAGVVHRDLKPGNVLLSRVGPKVIDFGIARALDDPDRLTESGHLVGTPGYMAPEQFRGITTTATDIFTWGAVVTFAATGRPPFGTGSPYELMHRILTDPPDLGGLEPPLRSLVAAALDKEPDRRPTARTLLLALVDDTDNPVDATSRILSTRWAPPPPTRVDHATRVDDSHAAGPLLDRPLVERTPAGRSRLALTVVAATTLVAVIATAATLRDDPGVGDRPRAEMSASVVARPALTGPGTPTTADTTRSATVITIGTRVPAQGEITLGVGEQRIYRLHLTGDRDVYVTGYVCASLVRWRLSRAGGDKVGSGHLGCLQSGPYALRAGDYELLVGEPGVDGAYALKLAER
ncbi:serine/threonine-protein kinase [Catellatospora sp. KI3]|uniref:serine/threonine-protein kinase n=1 Tax=Catellatospora sp. KI3 TaxID=3041620 RepID=UPI0024829477|nr:serine/threonine-protein kinase [Catellatospora sp. KI3]MDI1463439.1 serine/threonine-protein kinase [Catellatospora sp. KI3]